MAQEKWMVDGEKVIDLEMVRRLKVSLIAGQVNIVGHDEPGARVEVHSVHGKALKIAIDGDTLEIDHPQLSWDNFIDVFASFRGSASADVSIMVPSDVALKFGVVSATALISGLTHGGRISTVSGDIVVDNMSDDLEINSVNGEIAVRDHHGNVTSKTVSGDVTVTGDVQKFRADSMAGKVFLDFAGIPEEARINTVSGKLQLDDSEVTGIRGSYSGKYGELDGKWFDFTASTVNGDVAVLHGTTVQS